MLSPSSKRQSSHEKIRRQSLFYSVIVTSAYAIVCNRCPPYTGSPVPNLWPNVCKLNRYTAGEFGKRSVRAVGCLSQQCVVYTSSLCKNSRLRTCTISNKCILNY